ncbi:Septin spn4 [Malassezia yamatoensis]|uniref:Septin spn4 n=1 Tax=Malassezia yamatoensis TaxID=253288 RepID=A0AAJ5YSK4_9BASI|nr:Septin spn4 [Malassezia yamatoensis]
MTTTTTEPIGISNLPNQRHKIASRTGANFTLMVVVINTLFRTELAPNKDESQRYAKQLSRSVEVDVIKAELEEKQFHVNLTVIDTPGFGDYVNNRDCWLPLVDFIDDQYETYMRQDQQPYRKQRTDMRVHACLYFITPTGHSLKPLDVEVMKRLASRVNLIPVIAKSDTMVARDLQIFKERVREVIRANNIQVYAPPLDPMDEANGEHARALMASMPFSVIGSTQDVRTPDGRIVRGREYPWGVSEVENENHCDFKKLRSLLIRTHMLDLVNSTEDLHYETYRQTQMETRKFGESKVKKADNPRFKEEEDALRRKFTDQVKLEEGRFRQWEQHLIAERDRLNKDLETAHSSIKQLEAEIESMQATGRGSRR